jgi:hypothetical protein
LGVGTAFLFSSSLTMFLSAYSIKTLPVAYIFSACLLLIFNRIYGYLDEKYSSPKLLAVVISFSALSVLVFWLLATIVPFYHLPLIISGWYMLIYMLVGYAFWGLASILFNVRESRRLFSIVGAGDIPAKMLGYFFVSALVPVMGVNNLLWVSIACFGIAGFLLNRFKNRGFITDEDPNSPTHANEHHTLDAHGLITRFFNNNLVLYIALLSLLSYCAFSFIDFTFLSNIKLKFQQDTEIASFIGIFFASGRVLAIFIKVLFSSRVISRFGLTNALLVTPLALLTIAVLIIIFGNGVLSNLYVFGFMALLAEILRSTFQEPVFFILFQPLKPHDRLRGHLIAKGHTLPFALLGVGTFLVLYLQTNAELPITLVAKLLVALLLCWIFTIFFIKQEYLQTLITSLKKGYFTGAELFLDDASVTNMLLQKTESKKPLEVIHSLNLLERSGYNEIFGLLTQKLESEENGIKEYVLERMIANNMTDSLPTIKAQLQNTTGEHFKPKLIKALYYLDQQPDPEEQMQAIGLLDYNDQKAAMEGLLNRKDEKTQRVVMERLLEFSTGTAEEKLLALEVAMESTGNNYSALLSNLLHDDDHQIYKKAIEAAGKTKTTELIETVVEKVIRTGAYSSLKRSILNYGDVFFSGNFQNNAAIPSKLLLLFIKTAGNVKGDYSTGFLVDSLQKGTGYLNEIVEALWLKKAQLSPEAMAVIDNSLTEKLDESRCKADYYKEMANNKNLALLAEAIIMEVRKDVQVLLKGFALLYNREKIDRVIELLNLGNTAKMSNAVEILELIVPKKKFALFNPLAELIDDVKHNHLALLKTTDLRTNAIIEEILKTNKANFSEWTKSVTCYVLPKLKRNGFFAEVLNKEGAKEDYLYNETRSYVLTLLK